MSEVQSRGARFGQQQGYRLLFAIGTDVLVVGGGSYFLQRGDAPPAPFRSPRRLVAGERGASFDGQPFLVTQLRTDKCLLAAAAEDVLSFHGQSLARAN